MTYPGNGGPGNDGFMYMQPPVIFVALCIVMTSSYLSLVRPQPHSRVLKSRQALPCGMTFQTLTCPLNLMEGSTSTTSSLSLSLSLSLYLFLFLSLSQYFLGKRSPSPAQNSYPNLAQCTGVLDTLE